MHRLSDPRWKVKTKLEPAAIEKLAGELGLSSIIAQVLLNRGIDGLEAARRFFNPSWEQTHDPFLMQDMDLAAERIKAALDGRERVLVLGDYDVDGTTATAALIWFFKELGHTVPFYIPNRIVEGYGISEQGIRRAKDLGCSLVIAVDCGVTAHAEVDLARELGIDVIICDHHEPKSTLPDAVAVLDPKRPDCDYPFSGLAGVGVTFKLMQAVASKLDADEDLARQHLDLVAVGTTADIVPLVDENRVFVSKGLELLADTSKMGLRALMKVANLKPKKYRDGPRLSTGQVVFIIAPRINAVGRMGDAERAVRLLMAQSEQQALNIARVLEHENAKRKEVDERTSREAIARIEERYNPQENRALVLVKDGWHPGVVGIVASRIVERYHRPTIMIAQDGDRGKGSARSIRGFDIHKALQRCEDLLEGFGGHTYAAGLTVRTDRIDELRQRLNAIAWEVLSEEDMVPSINTDGEVSFDELNGKLFQVVRRLSPFGPSNMRPVFTSTKLEVVGQPTVVGSNHLKFKVRQNGKVFEAIAFNQADQRYKLDRSADGLDMAYVIEENEWLGQTTMQLSVRAFRPHVRG